MSEAVQPQAMLNQGVELVIPGGRATANEPVFAQPPPVPVLPVAAAVPSPQMPQMPGQPPIAPGQPVQPSQLPPAQGPALQAPAGSLFDKTAPAVPMSIPTAVSSGTAGPPTCKVTFEVHGNPFKQEAFFHEVIREGASLILVFDRRAVGFPRVFPQTTDSDLAVLVEGRNMIYRTACTGIQFPFRDFDMHILLIKEEYPIPD